MYRVFSVEDIPDHLWSPAPVTHPPTAEEESRASSLSALDTSPLPPSSLKPGTADNEVVEIKNNCNPSTAAFVADPVNVLIDSKEQQVFLRSRLDLECAAVALTQKESATARYDNGRSSGEQLSNDDEVEEERIWEAKRGRRMLSNRESARRSRRRKQAYLTELETQISELRAENSCLVNRLIDISQKCNAEAVDNRVLKADVETLRAKVMMAEETVKRVTGTSNVNPSYVRDMMIHNWHDNIISFDDGSPSDTPAGAAAAPAQHFYQPAPPNPATPPVDGNKIGTTPSPSMQQRIRGDISSGGTQCSTG